MTKFWCAAVVAVAVVLSSATPSLGFAGIADEAVPTPGLVNDAMSLAISYETTFYPEDGGVPRPLRTPGLAVPVIGGLVENTPIDVDGDHVPDLVASATINAARDTVSVFIRRVPTETSRLSMSIEVHAKPPPKEGQIRDTVYFGYHARGGAPSAFRGTVRFNDAAKTFKSPLASDKNLGPDYDVLAATYTVSPPPPKAQGRFGTWAIRVVGGTYDVGNRADPIGGSLHYFPNTAKFTAGLGLSVPDKVTDGTPLVIRHADNRGAGSLTASVIPQGKSELRNVVTSIGGVPKELKVTVGRRVDYEASSRVKSFRFAADLPEPAKYESKPEAIRVAAKDLPTRFQLLYSRGLFGVSTLSAGAGFGEIAAAAAGDAASAKPPYNGGRNEIVIANGIGQKFYAGVRVANIREALLVKEATENILKYDFDVAHPRPLSSSVRLDGNTTHIALHIQEPPKQLVVRSPINKGATKFDITSSAPIPWVSVLLEKKLRDSRDTMTNLRADITNIPRRLDVCIAADFACGRRQDVQGRSTKLGWKAEQLFDLLSDISVAVKTYGTSKKKLIGLSGEFCTGHRATFAKNGCNRPWAGTYVKVKDLRFRDVTMALGSGSSCPPGVKEDGLLLMALHTDTAGITAKSVKVNTLSDFIDCFGYHGFTSSGAKVTTAKVPDAVAARKYATILETDSLPPEDKLEAGTIYCRSSMSIKTEGGLKQHVDGGAVLHGCWP